MPISIGLITYLTASASMAVLVVLLVFSQRTRNLGHSLLAACAASAIWAAVVALSTVLTRLPDAAVQFSELVRNASWLFVLIQLLGLQSSGDAGRIGDWHWRRLFFTGLALSLSLISAGLWLPPANTGLIGIHYQLVLLLWLIFALAGLVTIEQLYLNATKSARWSIKFLCLGLGALFAYDFFMYAEALLFRELDGNLWLARGLINTLAMPFLGVAIARNGNWPVNLQISRQVAFHTVTLTGAGLYLLAMAGVGYAIRYWGGTWGEVLQMGFLGAAVALLVIVLFSDQVRANIRVFLSKHFFAYRYDYRVEWLKFTQALANLNDDVPEGIIRVLAPLVSSSAGMLWACEGNQPMRLLARWEMPAPPTGSSLGRLPECLREKDWVVDLDEWRQTPALYEYLELPDWLPQDRTLWLLIPLVFRDQLQAVLLLKRSSLKTGLNWEDRDLLKTAGRQAATHLAQYLASEALVEARQFDAFNRLSAYVVHDLKNILAQQSLIVSNAARHRDNPAFISDMIGTVENSVARMKRLMEQMRSGIRSAPVDKIFLLRLLQEVIAGRANNRPVPRAEFQAKEFSPSGVDISEAGVPSEAYVVEADRDRLATVFNHLIQNAQEATEASGMVLVRLDSSHELVTVAIEDNGIGMAPEFIRDRLFRPFESTKGLTGMGIGAFESREYIRQLGGDISVESTPGEGTVFYVTLPRVIDDDLSHNSTEQTRANTVQSAETEFSPNSEKV